MPSTFSTIRKNIRLDFSHRVYFTKDCFSHTNDTLSDIVQPHRKNQPSKIIIYLDEGMLDGNPNLPDQIKGYFQARTDALQLVCSPIFIRGGEAAKNEWELVEKIWTDLNTFSLCRHSYVIVIGGGAALDLVGFAASTAHPRYSIGPPAYHHPEPGRWRCWGEKRHQLLWKEKLGWHLFGPVCCAQ